jgi:hypothetical protein
LRHCFGDAAIVVIQDDDISPATIAFLAAMLAFIESADASVQRQASASGRRG